MKFKPILPAILFIAIYLSFSSLGFADGTFIPTLKRKLPDIPIQRAILKYHNDIETLIIEATLDGGGDSFGWIIPVPNIPNRFEKISPGLLKTLSLQTQPKIIHNWGPHIWWLLLIFVFLFMALFFGRKGVFYLFLLLFIAGIAIGVLSNFLPYRGGSSGQTFGIMQVSRQIIGNYEIFVLKAKKVADLNTWLKDNGFRTFPKKANPIIDDYIDKKWCFVAAKLIRKNEGISTPHPILVEFEADRPVYPMRLTTLSDSTLYLELFFLSTNEAVPNNYKLRKEYCNIFYSSIYTKNDIPYLLRDYGRLKKPYKKFSAVKKFDRVRSVWGDDEIAHPDAEKIMWGNCVLTKFAGKVTSQKMTEDMYFGFKNATIFRSSLFSKEGSIGHGIGNTLIVLIIGLVMLLGKRKTVKSNRDEKVVDRKKQLKYFSILLLISLMVLPATYVNDGEKVLVEKFSRIRFGWKIFHNLTAALIADLDINVGMDDIEIIDKFKEMSANFAGYHNPFTKGPVIIEDSPGNIIIERNNGNITAIKSYWQDGTPILLFTIDLKTKDRSRTDRAHYL